MNVLVIGYIFGIIVIYDIGVLVRSLSPKGDGKGGGLSDELRDLPQFKNNNGDDTDQSDQNITPDPPDPETTTVVTKSTNTLPLHPKFQMREITPKQCRSLNTDNCVILPGTGNCGRGKGLLASCSTDAPNAEVEFFFIKIQRLNASRGLEITLTGERDFHQRTFAPVADVLIILEIANFDGFQLSLLRDLELPLLTHIGIVKSNNVEILQDDLLFFPTLTMFVMARSTVSKIEEGAFDSLQQLKLATFETGFNIKKLTKQQKDYLRLLHCDCEYSWLRKFLEKHPYLISPRSAGEIHAFGGILSNAFSRRQIYAPVDCAEENLIGAEDQVPFSVNDDC